jgi:hypothetical protein
MHLFAFCRVHPNDQELAPLGENQGVFFSSEEVEDALDALVAASERPGIATDEFPLIEHRGPGILMTQTVTASDKRSIEYGGDGRCHRVFTQVWCIGDPDECGAMITAMGHQKMMEAMPQLLMSDDPEIRDMALRGMMNMLSAMADDLPDDQPSDPMRLPDLPKSRDFGMGYANEPFDDFLDFGGYDEPNNKKRPN